MHVLHQGAPANTSCDVYYIPHARMHTRYHMYDSSGTGMGTLDVKYSSDGSTWTSFVTKSSNQGRQVIYKEIVRSTCTSPATYCAH